MYYTTRSIVQKLSDMGWEDELALMAPSYEELQSYSDVNKPKELTERGMYALIFDLSEWPI